MGHDAADGERLLQSEDERDCFPGRNFATAALLRERGRRGELWRHRRGHRPRNDAWLRRSGAAVRQSGKFDRLVVAAVRGRIQEELGSSRTAIQGIRTVWGIARE